VDLVVLGIHPSRLAPHHHVKDSGSSALLRHDDPQNEVGVFVEAIDGVVVEEMAVGAVVGALAIAVGTAVLVGVLGTAAGAVQDTSRIAARIRFASRWNGIRMTSSPCLIAALAVWASTA
jgi:hypothetical protein